MPPELTIVIPVHGQLHATRRVLEALHDQQEDGWDATLVIEDDHSPDETVWTLRRDGYDVRTDPERRYFNGILRPWLANCPTEFLAFLNNDILPRDNFLEELRLSFQEGWDILCPRTNTPPDDKKPRVSELRHQMGWAMSFRVPAIRELPSIPEDLRLWYGDTWIFHHAWERKLRVGLMNHTSIDHEVSRTINHHPEVTKVIREDQKNAEKYRLTAFR